MLLIKNTRLFPVQASAKAPIQKNSQLRTEHLALFNSLGAAIKVGLLFFASFYSTQGCHQGGQGVSTPQGGSEKVFLDIFTLYLFQF